MPHAVNSNVAEIVVTPEPMLVGRSRSVPLQLSDATVSRQHATLRRDQFNESAIVVQDLDSRYGTFLNGAQVRLATANPGDVIRFGRKASFRVQRMGRSSHSSPSSGTSGNPSRNQSGA